MKYLILLTLLVSCASPRIVTREKIVTVIPNVLKQQDKMNVCIHELTDKFLNMGLKPDLEDITGSCKSTYQFFGRD